MSETPVQEHKMAESFELNGQWCTPCSCGKKFTGSSPSTAFGKWSKHSKENTTAAEVRATPSARIRQCGCGCGQPLAPRAGGLFRSGHDARFKSILTLAHAEKRLVRHPATGKTESALSISDWLDERRGSGTFWRDKVLAGHKPAPERKTERVAVVDLRPRGSVRVDLLMADLAVRRPAPGDTGTVSLRSGRSYGARVLRRNGEDSLEIRLLDGPECGKCIVVGDSKFAKAGR